MLDTPNIRKKIPAIEKYNEENADTASAEKETELFTAAKKAGIRSIVEDNTDKKANRRLRFRYAQAVYSYLIWYSVSCLFLVLMQGLCPYFELPDAVLVTIVGSAGVSAIGLVGFGVNGLFKSAK
jgi:hypothetical protein